MGLTFPDPLGLAAGFDKNAVGIDALAALGFGFVEVGTVTGEPQPGNPKPRLFRLPDDRAVVNRMGFNNDGAEVVARRLAPAGARAHAAGRVLGVNIGKTKVVPEDDRRRSRPTTRRAPGCSRRTPTTSSSTSARRTPRGCATCRRSRSSRRCSTRRSRDRPPTTRRRTPVPLLVKIAPDLADDDVLAVADLALELGLDGIVATNTTISRDGLRSTPEQVEAAGAGGLSGAPLTRAGRRGDAAAARPGRRPT